MTPRILTLATLAAAALAACSITPERNTALDQASSRYAAARGDAQVTKLASDELDQAGDALRAAENAHRDDAGKTRIDHLAYMASQRITIAQHTAAGKAEQAQVAGAAAERDRMRLAQRTSEADAAQRQLAVSQQGNVQKAAELASAEERTQRGNERVGELEMQLRELNARRTERGMVVTLGDVLFDTGQARIVPDSEGRLGKLAEFFKRHPQRTASIEGYTDNVGSADSNVTLSQRRAQAVVTALVDLGVASNRLSTRAHGEEGPAASNATPAGRQLNRRVEVVFPMSADATAGK
jgi:outer membrane protein OmpA-like peptidoglycan-associated protein